MVDEIKSERKALVKDVISSIGDSLNTKWDSAIVNEASAKGALQTVNDLTSIFQNTYICIKAKEENKEKDSTLADEFYATCMKNLEIVKINTTAAAYKFLGRKEALKESVDFVKEKYRAVDFFSTPPDERGIEIPTKQTAVPTVPTVEKKAVKPAPAKPKEVEKTDG